MIIFYKKQTGEIIGTIEGRIHNKESLNMWIGDKNTTDRVIIQWKPVKFYNSKGEEVSKDSPEVFTADYEPESQKEIMMEVEKNPILIYNYKINLKTKLLEKK